MRTLTVWNKKAMLTVTCTALATLMMLTVGAWSVLAGGLHATGRTVAENESIWGNPSVIQQYSNGVEKRFYKNTNPMFDGYRTFVYKDGKVIDDGGFAVSTPEPQRQQPDYKVVMTGKGSASN